MSKRLVTESGIGLAPLGPGLRARLVVCGAGTGEPINGDGVDGSGSRSSPLSNNGPGVVERCGPADIPKLDGGGGVVEGCVGPVRN